MKMDSTFVTIAVIVVTTFLSCLIFWIYKRCCALREPIISSRRYQYQSIPPINRNIHIVDSDLYYGRNVPLPYEAPDHVINIGKQISAPTIQQRYCDWNVPIAVTSNHIPRSQSVNRRDPSNIENQFVPKTHRVHDRNRPALSVLPKDTRTQNAKSTLHSGDETATSVHHEIVNVNVIDVPDGDGVKAFDVKAYEILDVRLIGIDAPEMKGRQPFALEAKMHLQRLVLRKSAVLTKYSKDQYDRVLGNLSVPGTVDNASLEMLKAGLGKGAEYGGLRKEFYQAERIAKQQKKGIWALDNLVLPGEYKRKLRET